MTPSHIGNWFSGALLRRPVNGFLSPGLAAKDPQVPNLPLGADAPVLIPGVFARYSFKGQNSGIGASIISNILSISAGDFITVVGTYADNLESTAWTVSNNGSAITWTLVTQTNTADNCKQVLWTGTAGATPPTDITVTSTAGSFINGAKALTVGAYSGQHATDPLPAGNIFSGTDATDVNQAITPGGNGSALQMVVADWQASDTFAANANSVIAEKYHQAGQMTAAFIRPAIQPRPDGSAFTIGETDTAGKISWIAFEVRAAAVIGSTGTIVSRLINDSSILTGVQSVAGTITSRLKNDLSSLTGVQILTGNILSLLVNDLSSLTGTQTSTATGTITSRLVNDKSSLTGVQTATGFISSLLKADNSSLVGSQSGAVSGSILSKLVDDRSSLIGIQSALGTITSKLNNDLSSLLGVQSSPVTGFVSSILNDDSSVVIGTSGVQPITVVKPKGAGKKSGKKALTYAERKKIDEQVFNALYGLTEELAEKADISKDFITKEFVDEIVKTKVDNISIDDFYLPSTVIDQSFYEETAKIKTELILKKLQKAQEDDDEHALLLLL